MLCLQSESLPEDVYSDSNVMSVWYTIVQEMFYLSVVGKCQ